MCDSADKRVCWKLQEYVAHAGEVRCLALGQKTGRVLATGGDDKKINMWSLDKPNCLMSFSGHTSAVETVRFDDTEKLLASGCSAGVVKIWDIEEAKIQRNLSGHKGAIRSVELYPFGDFAASTSTDHNIKVWDLRRKGCINTYKGHTEPVGCVRFSPDGRWMVTGDDSGLIKIWDLKKGELLFELKEHTSAVNMITFHPSELLLASGSTDRSVKFWDLDAKQLISSTHTVNADGLPVGTISFHPEGSCLYSTSKAQLGIYGWEPVNLYQLVTLPDSGEPADVAFSQNQLVGACFSKNSVSTFVVEINKLPPVAVPPESPAAKHQPLSNSARKTFVAGEIPVKPAEKQGKSNPVIADDDASGDNVVKAPNYQPVQDRYQPFKAPESADSVGRNRPSAADGGRNGSPALSEADVLSTLRDGRTPFMSEMSHRQRSMKILRNEWNSRGVKTAVDVAIGMKDLSTVCDLLQVLLCKVDLWDLTLCQTLLPTLGDLIASNRHENYMHIGLSSLWLVLKTFGSLIKANVATPPPQGIVDFSRQDRYYKCLSCYNKLLAIRSDLETKSNQYEGRLGAKIQEMLQLVQMVTRR